MNDKKICFISAVNNYELYEECLMYINSLDTDDEFEIEIKPIYNSKSICSAYNMAMLSSDAKYKVYLHQDTFIINKSFIKDIVKLFKKNKNIGLIGACGAKYIPRSGVWWECSEKYGKVYENRGIRTEILGFDEVKKDYEEVDCVDGLILITQYDIRWREDIFDGWHLYDTSQCMEFKKNKYKIAVPNQVNPWFIHYCGDVSVKDYDKYRAIFINEYNSMLK